MDWWTPYPIDKQLTQYLFNKNENLISNNSNYCFFSILLSQVFHFIVSIFFILFFFLSPQIRHSLQASSHCRRHLFGLRKQDAFHCQLWRHGCEWRGGGHFSRHILASNLSNSFKFIQRTLNDENKNETSR